MSFQLAPKPFWWAELISQFFLDSNCWKNIPCPSGKLKTEFTSLIAKSTSPRLLDATFFARCFTDDATSGGRVLDPCGQLQCMGTLGANGLKYLLPNRITPFSCYEILARFWFYLSLFLLPKSLLILSNTVLRGSWIFGLLPLKESWDMTWIIIQSTIFLSLSFLIQSVIPSFTELLNSSGSYIIVNSKRDTIISICCRP